MYTPSMLQAQSCLPLHGWPTSLSSAGDPNFPHRALPPCCPLSSPSSTKSRKGDFMPDRASLLTSAHAPAALDTLHSSTHLAVPGVKKRVVVLEVGQLSRRGFAQVTSSGFLPPANQNGPQQARGPPPLASSAGGAGGGSSYLSMWKRAREREEEERRQGELEAKEAEEGRRAAEAEAAAMARREQQLQSILQVSEEEKRAAERQSMIDRAAAALAAAQAVLADVDGDRQRRQLARGRPTAGKAPEWAGSGRLAVRAEEEKPIRGPPVSTAQLTSTAPSEPAPDLPGSRGSGSFLERFTLGSSATPGPDFWTWAPPPSAAALPPQLQKGAPVEPKAAFPLLELEVEARAADLSLPLESQVRSPKSSGMPSLPPLQSLLEVEQTGAVEPATGAQQVWEQEREKRSVPDLAAETAAMVGAASEEASGVHPDGSRWWKQSGVEERANGEVCRWTVLRGASADGAREWEDKWWETSDAFDYKELGAEKSGRDAAGGVWRESWREAMWQDAKNGLLHMEKSADKWGRDARGGEWHEKWWEHYDAQGRAEKWADKWSKIDPATPLDPGHGHVWHERWGEEYDGRGGAMKYTDKWAERCEGEGSWTKWGDKWDERFDQGGRGRRGGETWWEGAMGERWNRTWGEGHDNSGWVHKYGQSSSGEHWDTREPMDTWYEGKPHFGFKECFENSWRLRQVGRAKGKKKRGGL